MMIIIKAKMISVLIQAQAHKVQYHSARYNEIILNYSLNAHALLWQLSTLWEDFGHNIVFHCITHYSFD